MVKRCIRCEKQCTKFFSKVGGTVYVRTFLKSEKGITEEELEDAVICGACRTFIYNHVFRPERVKSQGSKRALPDTSDAAQAASKAAESAAKRVKENDKYHTGEH